MSTSSDSTFAERLAYALLLYYWREGRELAQTTIAAAVKRKAPSVAEWYDRDTAPVDWQVHAPLAKVLGGDIQEAWLIRNQGEPIKPHIWKEWLQERRKRPMHSTDRRVARPDASAAGRGRRRKIV